MIDQGFIERPQSGDLRDLIARRHDEHGTVVTAPDDDLLVAYGRMKLYDISQLPVLDDQGQVAGIIDEEDILLRVFEDENRFRDKVAGTMTPSLETIEVDRPIEDLVAIFEQGLVAIVTEGDRFLGLITRIDLLNHLRRRMK